MENREDYLDALTEFSRKRPRKIPELLEQFLRQVAKTGETLFPWTLLKPLFLAKLEEVMQKFEEEYDPDEIPSCPNVENISFQVYRARIREAVDRFVGTPFTIQRLCELLTDPKRHYKRGDKFMRGLEKNVLVVSTVDPFGKKITSESRNFARDTSTNDTKSSTSDTKSSTNDTKSNNSCASSSPSALPPVPKWTSSSSATSSVNTDSETPAMPQDSDPEETAPSPTASSSCEEHVSSSESANSQEMTKTQDRIKLVRAVLDTSIPRTQPCDTSGTGPSQVSTAETADTSVHQEAAEEMEEASSSTAEPQETEEKDEEALESAALMTEAMKKIAEISEDSEEDIPSANGDCFDDADDEQTVSASKTLTDSDDGVCNARADRTARKDPPSRQDMDSSEAAALTGPLVTDDERVCNGAVEENGDVEANQNDSTMRSDDTCEERSESSADSFLSGSSTDSTEETSALDLSPPPLPVKETVSSSTSSKTVTFSEISPALASLADSPESARETCSSSASSPEHSTSSSVVSEDSTSSSCVAETSDPSRNIPKPCISSVSASLPESSPDPSAAVTSWSDIAASSAGMIDSSASRHQQQRASSPNLPVTSTPDISTTTNSTVTPEMCSSTPDLPVPVSEPVTSTTTENSSLAAADKIVSLATGAVSEEQESVSTQKVESMDIDCADYVGASGVPHADNGDFSTESSSFSTQQDSKSSLPEPMEED